MNVTSTPIEWVKKEGSRLDVGPYISRVVEAKFILEDLPTKKEELKDVTKNIINPGRFSRTWVTSRKYGTPFLSGRNVVEPDLSHCRLISDKIIQDNPELLIENDWTLITRSGTIGRMAYVRSDMDNIGCTEHAMRVIPDEQKILPGYVYAFLSSRFGVPLVLSGTYGSVIQSIEPEHIESLPVPRLDKSVEEEIHTLIQNSADLLTNYQSSLESATNKFFESLGLRDTSVSKWHRAGPDTAFSVDNLDSTSFRPLNYNPRSEEIKERIKSVDFKYLGECTVSEIDTGDRFTRVDASPEFGYKLIGQRDLFRLDPEGRWVAKWSVPDDVIVDPGTILVPARGTLGESELYCRCQFIWGEWSSYAYSENMLRIYPDNEVMPSGCLYAFLRSESGFRMLRSVSIGSKLQHHNPDLLNKIPVPKPPADKQKNIHKQVIEAYHKRHKAVQLEKRAIKKVESNIQEMSDGKD